MPVPPAGSTRGRYLDAIDEPPTYLRSKLLGIYSSQTRAAVKYQCQLLNIAARSLELVVSSRVWHHLQAGAALLPQLASIESPVKLRTSIRYGHKGLPFPAVSALLEKFLERVWCSSCYLLVCTARLASH